MHSEPCYSYDKAIEANITEKNKKIYFSNSSHKFSLNDALEKISSIIAKVFFQIFLHVSPLLYFVNFSLVSALFSSAFAVHYLRNSTQNKCVE